MKSENRHVAVWGSRMNNGRLTALTVLLALYCLLCAPLVSFGEISAKAAVVIDSVNDKILFAKNPHVKLPPASTTKLVTALVVLDRLSPDTVVTVSKYASGTPSVAPHLKPGERFTVEELLYLALMRSVNGAAVALAEAVAGSEDAFVTLMNQKVASLEADNTHFINASGLPGQGQYITAYDLAKVMRASLTYPLLREIVNTKTRVIHTAGGRTIFIKNTNKLLWSDEELIGGKTGYTKAARHCFVCAADKGNTMLIASVLGESARDNLWQDASLLLVKGHEVLDKKLEPVIYFTGVNEKPMLLASYKADTPNKATYKSRKYTSAKKSKMARAETKTKGLKKSRHKKNPPGLSGETAQRSADKDV